MNFVKIDYLEYPSIENIVDLCKIKAYVWIQLLQRDGKVSDVDFYDKENICVDTDKVFETFEVDVFTNNDSSYRLILSYKSTKLYFRFETKSVEKKDPPLFIVEKDAFMYPNVMYFKAKPKEVGFDRLAEDRILCNIRTILFGTISIKKIYLIDDQEYKKLISRVSSPYSKETLNNSLEANDITFTMFYHPELLPQNKIYGFYYHITNPTSIMTVDIRLLRPKHVSNRIRKT